MSKDLFIREDNLTYSISRNELERRWKDIRKKMEDKKFDFLLVQCQQRPLGGYFRWFTDVSPSNYHATLVFPLDGKMTVIAQGPASPEGKSPPQWMYRGVEEVILLPSYPTVTWQDGWHAKTVSNTIGKNRKCTVGLVGLGCMSAAFYENILKELSGARIENTTSLVDEVKTIKSDEEIRLLKEATQMHKESYEIAKRSIRPGRSALEVLQEIRNYQILHRSEDQTMFMKFGRPGSVQFQQWLGGNTFVSRELKQGDIIDILIESSSMGGYWYNLRRTLCIGNAPVEYKEAQKICREARRILAANCRPGIIPAEALKASNLFLEKKGCPAEDRLVGHGQGCDLVERPLIQLGEDATFESGTVLALHPTTKLTNGNVSLSDNYLVTASGATPLSNDLADDDEIVSVGQ